MQEPRQGDILNEGILKELTSGFDSIQARAPYQRAAVTFIPQFKLVVCANVLPEIKAQDHGTWRRIRVIPFLSLFTENPVDNDPHKPYQYLIDSTIDEKFDTWKTVFLAMLVERVLVTNGKVVDCETVLKASNDYKHKQDVISQFIEEKIVRAPGEKVKKAAINNEFKLWHESNFGIKGPQSKEVHVYLDKLFGEHDQQGWRDIKIIYDTSNRDEEIDPDEISDTL
jgi:phage/plasmid-associated DNA primase